MASRISNEEVRAFWERHPVAADAIGAAPGTPEFFASFDRLREADACEPYAFSNRIHGYDQARGKHVLDVGCGNGYVLSRYAMHGAEVYGVDLTDTAVFLSQRRFALAGHRGQFHRTDGDTLPFPGAMFDIACAMGVLHHIENPGPMLGEMWRVLKPGGELILMLYHKNSWKYRVLIPLRRVFDPAFRGKSQAEALNMNDGGDCPLAKVYTRADVSALLERFTEPRFTINQLSWKQLLLVPALARVMERVLPQSSESFFARHLGWNLYARAVKSSA